MCSINFSMPRDNFKSAPFDRIWCHKHFLYIQPTHSGASSCHQSRHTFQKHCLCSSSISEYSHWILSSKSKLIYMWYTAIWNKTIISPMVEWYMWFWQSGVSLMGTWQFFIFLMATGLYFTLFKKSWNWSYKVPRGGFRVDCHGEHINKKGPGALMFYLTCCQMNIT